MSGKSTNNFRYSDIAARMRRRSAGDLATIRPFLPASKKIFVYLQFVRRVRTITETEQNSTLDYEYRKLHLANRIAIGRGSLRPRRRLAIADSEDPQRVRRRLHAGYVPAAQTQPQIARGDRDRDRRAHRGEQPLGGFVQRHQRIPQSLSPRRSGPRDSPSRPPTSASARPLPRAARS